MKPQHLLTLALILAGSFLFMVLVLSSAARAESTRRLENALKYENECLNEAIKAQQREIRSLQNAILVSTRTGYQYGQRFVLEKIRGGNREPFSEDACLDFIRESFHLTNTITKSQP